MTARFAAFHSNFHPLLLGKAAAYSLARLRQKQDDGGFLDIDNMPTLYKLFLQFYTNNECPLTLEGL
jgi:hypothetical protein